MTQATEAPPDDRVVYREELARLADVQSDTLTKWIKAKRIPAPEVAVSRKRQGWKASTLRALGYVVPISQSA